MLFTDRIDAGQQLAENLSSLKLKNPIVLALPRGGVIVANQVAKALNAPLSLIISRKIGHPNDPEYALAAITQNSEAIDSGQAKSIDQSWLKEQIKKERLEIKRRIDLYLKNQTAVSARDKTAILVDDGIATGLTVRAALLELKAQKPKKIIIATPVVAKDIAGQLKPLVNQLVAPDVPEYFQGAIGNYYQNFDQVTDDEVITIMKNYK